MTKFQADCNLFLIVFSLTEQVSFTCKEVGLTHLTVIIMYCSPLVYLPKAKKIRMLLMVIGIMPVTVCT
jgi:hypothetical protein